MGILCCRRKLKKKIVLLLVGLDNAGKTAAAKGLAGESCDTIVPTVGFSVINLQYLDYNVKIFDLGGGSEIRAIWDRYFVDAHGVIFVVDSSDYLRLDEAQNVFEELIRNEKIAGKPLLILANKQDNQDALDEIDLVEKLQIEQLVNSVQCPTMVESCSALTVAKKSGQDQGIINGYRWLLNHIIKEYKSLNERVETDVMAQEVINQQNRQKIIERLKHLQLNDINEVQNGINTKPIDNSVDSNLNPILVQKIQKTKSFSDLSIHSEEAFPHIYNENLEDTKRSSKRRPKSAVEAVRMQLEKTSLKRNKSILLTRSNRTSPALIFGVNRPASASTCQGKSGLKMEVQKQRTLKSAGDCLEYVTELPNSVPYASNGDNGIHQELNHLRDINGLHRIKPKLPPIKNKFKTELPLVHNSESNRFTTISTVDVD